MRTLAALILLCLAVVLLVTGYSVEAVGFSILTMAVLFVWPKRYAR